MGSAAAFRLTNMIRKAYILKRRLLLDRRVRRNIGALFDENDRHEAYKIIRNFKVCWPLEQLRCELAALKYSNGSLNDLKEAVELGECDLRDLLMAADFGSDVKAHLSWRPEEVG